MVEIIREQRRLLYASSKGPIIVSVAVGGLLCWLMRSVIDQTVLVYWFTLFLAISVIRFSLVCLLESGTQGEQFKDFWHKPYLLNTYAVAMVWGAAAFLLFPEHSHSHQIIFYIIVLGVAAGAVSALCSSLSLVGGFLSLLLAPLIIKLMFLGNEDTWVEGFLLLVFLGFTFTAAVKINVNIRDRIRLHLQSAERGNISLG